MNILLKAVGESTSILWRASTTNNIGEEAFFTRNAEFGVGSEIIFILSLIQQRLEKRVLEQGEFNHKPLVVFTHIHD